MRNVSFESMTTREECNGENETCSRESCQIYDGAQPPVLSTTPIMKWILKLGMLLVVS